MNYDTNEDVIKKLESHSCFKKHECIECKVPAKRQCIPNENDHIFSQTDTIAIVQRCPKCNSYVEYTAKKMEDHSFISRAKNTSSKIKLVE